MTDDAKIYDISPAVLSDLAVWPGDVPFSRSESASIAAGDIVTLSSFTATAHLGAHADAPSHYDQAGRTIEQQPLELYLGKCEVVHVDIQPCQLVVRSMLPESFSVSRVLIVTNTYLDPNNFNNDFAGLDVRLIESLAHEGVKLIGVDTPSVDRFSDAQTLSAHAACAANDVAILEGLVLGGVPEGVYELIALPLKLVGSDASPVRAVLRDIH